MSNSFRKILQPGLLEPATSGCQKPCSHTSYNIYTLPDVAYEPEVNMSSVLAYWDTVRVLQSSEDLLYDANAIVAAVGGSLGLFLGFSCYDGFKKVLSYLEK